MTLAEYLAAKKLTASACAAGTGVAVSTITRIIKGEQMPLLETRIAIRKWSRGKVFNEKPGRTARSLTASPPVASKTVR